MKIDNIKWCMTYLKALHNPEMVRADKQVDINVNKAIEEIKQLEVAVTNDRWRPATETPDENGRYLIYYQQGNQRRIFVADYEYGLGWSNTWTNMTILKWMPLPAEPADV